MESVGPYLQRDILQPKSDMILSQFLQQLEKYEYVWQNIAATYRAKQHGKP